MRLPFPERIAFLHGLLFAGGLCVIQLLEGTTAPFALACFFFVIVSVLAFNQAGGFTRTSGAYIFLFATMTVIIGITWKAIIGEPAQSNLEMPLTVIYSFLGMMCVMYLSVVISQKLTLKRALLAGFSTDGAKSQAIIVGCLVTGLAVTFLVNAVTFSGGSVLSALNQVNRFLPLAIILGTIHTIRRSGGRRSVSLAVIIAGCAVFVQGVLSFSKEGMFTPLACWLIAAASQRYYFVRAQVLALLLLVFAIFYYLVPYSQYGRTLREPSFSKNVSTAVFLLQHLDYVRAQYKQGNIDEEEQGILGPQYYNSPQGFFDRLQAIAMDGALIAHTVQFGTFGYLPAIEAFENLVPHVIWKDKPPLITGNNYAHELDLLADEDTTTGVSFSSTADAFHMGGWTGIFLLAPVIHILFFTVFDSLCGDVRKSIWGLLAIAVFVHLAPEGGIGGLIYAVGFIAGGISFMAIMSNYVMPIIGSLVIGPNTQAVSSKIPFRPLPAGPYRG